MSIICISALTTDQKIQIGILAISCLGFLIAFITLIIFWRTLKAGQAQVNELHIQTLNNQKQAEYSLAQNQYNIYRQELEFIIETFKTLKFSDAKNQFPASYADAFNKANGINTDMIKIFAFLLVIEVSQITNEQRVAFKMQIFQPLIWNYQRLLRFLVKIKDDNILSNIYKDMFYEKIEHDLLQSYFRICNNQTTDRGKDYDLKKIFTRKYKDEWQTLAGDKKWIDEFYRVNNFYIENHTFRFKDLHFYQTTL